MGPLHISPDHNWIASLDYPLDSDGVLYLVSLKEQKRIPISWGRFPYGFSLDFWLDAQHLVFWTDFVEFDDAFQNVVVYDPFSDQQADGSYAYELNPLPDLPVDICHPGIDDCFGSAIMYPAIYSPDLALLAYLRTPQENRPLAFVLRDIKSGQDLWTISHKEMLYSTPSWSPDGNLLAIPIPVNDAGTQFELFAIGREGKATQLTHLANVHPKVIAKDPIWSPNGRYIAFWVNTHDSDEGSASSSQLAIFDIQTQHVTEYCLEGYYAHWSLDGRQIAFHSKSMDDDKRHIFLLDLNRNIVYDVAKDAYVAGWMTLP
jgi:hypothetical protein